MEISNGEMMQGGVETFETQTEVCTQGEFCNKYAANPKVILSERNERLISLSLLDIRFYTFIVTLVPEVKAYMRYKGQK